MFTQHLRKLIAIGPLAIPVLLGAQDIERIDLKKPVTFSGSLNISLQHYVVDGIAARRQPFTWTISGAPTLTVLGVQMPFQVLVGNFENRFYQPFNQYGISPRYKWLTVHAGYRNVNFSPYTLAGHRLLGGGVEINTAYQEGGRGTGLRMGLMYGRLNRSTALDSAQFANPLAYRPQPSFTRMAYAAKVGIGNAENYFDVSYLHGWDVEGSLDASLRDSVPPQRNTAVGLSWRKDLYRRDKRRLYWKVDVGGSAYTLDDRRADMDVGAQAGLTQGLLRDLIGARISTQFLTAGETGLHYQGANGGVGVTYKRIDPEYRSMGAYFFQNDMEQWTLAPHLRMDSGRVSVTANMGLQRDNIHGQRTVTSERIIGNLGVNWNPGQRFGLNAGWSNFGVTQNPTRVAPDAELFKQVSNSYTLVPYLNLVNDRTARSIQLVTVYQALNSPVESINAAPDQHTLVGAFVYSHTWVKRAITATASVNYNNTMLPQGDVGSMGAGAGFGFPVWKRKVQIGLNGMCNRNHFNGVENGYTLNGMADLSVAVHKKGRISLQGIYLHNQAVDETVFKTFDEITTRVTYGMNF
ncbi:MAG: hypothetical protein RBT71_04145 [Flavobacteriales bacterium]|jgi:hypothetical protein|nr:hypothetical protein [Flavobacteriales bacterium]